MMFLNRGVNFAPCSRRDAPREGRVCVLQQKAKNILSDFKVGDLPSGGRDVRQNTLSMKAGGVREKQQHVVCFVAELLALSSNQLCV